VCGGMSIKGKKVGDRPEREVRARINHEIDCKEVRLIDEEGKQVGVVPVRERW